MFVDGVVVAGDGGGVERVAAQELRELARREQAYRDGRPSPNLAGKIAILIDDGLATGSTMRAAVAALRKLHPAKIIVAVPTAAPSTCDEFKTEVDEIVCAETPQPFYAVGAWYDDFSQTTDDEVRELLAEENHGSDGDRHDHGDRAQGGAPPR